MNKKIAVVVDYFFWAPSENLYTRGASFYILNFMLSIALKNDVDVYCQQSNAESYPYIKNLYKSETPVTTEELEARNYDFVWVWRDNTYKSDKFLTINLQHSHSRLYRQKYVRRPFELFIKRIFNPSRYYTKEKIAEYRKTFQQTDIVLANSKIARDDYIDLVGLDKDDVWLIHPMVNIPKEEDIVKSKNDIFTFGMSALTFDLKGGYIFLQALYNLRKKCKKFRAKIIYPNYKNNKILQFVILFFGLNKYVEIVDYQQSMQDFYNSMDCIVVPSREETFGLVAIEAMSYKLPVIVSDIAGVADIIENGKNGFTFEIRKNPVKNLTKALFDVINNGELNIIGENAYNTAKENSFDNYCEKLDKILDEILIVKGKR